VGQLTLIDVQFRNIGSSGLAFGNFVNVEASSTKPGGCLFEKSLNGVYVWGGSKAEQRGIFSAKGCTFRKMTGWGLIAEIGASLVLQDSLIEEAGTSGENAGIYLKNGAHGFLTGTTLRNNNPHNIYMLGQNGELQMDGGALEGGKAAFVSVTTGACSASFTNVAQTGANGDGFKVIGDCKLSIQGTTPGACVVEKNVASGIFSNGTQPLTVANCIVRDNGALGIGVNNNATATISDTTLQHNGFLPYPFDAEGLLAAGNATITVKGGAILENRLWGVSLRSPGLIGATLILDGVDIRNNGQHGVRAAGAKSLTISGGALREHAAGAGLSLEAAVDVSLTGTLVEANATGILDLLPEGVSSSLKLSGCVLRGNEWRGLLARSLDLSLSLKDCAFEGNNTSGDPAYADIVLERPASPGSPAVGLAGLLFDGAAPALSGKLCGAAANLALGGKPRLLNLSDGCVSW
jgi:hypothetical protein